MSVGGESGKAVVVTVVAAAAVPASIPIEDFAEDVVVEFIDFIDVTALMDFMDLTAFTDFTLVRSEGGVNLGWVEDADLKMGMGLGLDVVVAVGADVVDLDSASSVALLGLGSLCGNDGRGVKYA